MTTLATLDAILAEMRDVFAAMPGDAPADLAAEIVTARRIALYGVGRSGLAAQGFAMRLAHLGLDAQFVGQLAAPPIGAGDLFLAALAVGRLPTGDALILVARGAGARIVVITAVPASVTDADCVVHLPARTMADPASVVSPLGSGVRAGAGAPVRSHRGRTDEAPRPQQRRPRPPPRQSALRCDCAGARSDPVAA